MLPPHSLRPINTDEDLRSPMFRNKAVVSFTSELVDNDFGMETTIGTRRSNIAAIPRMTPTMQQDAMSSLGPFDVDAPSRSPSHALERVVASSYEYSWNEYPAPINSRVSSQLPSRKFSSSEEQVMLAQKNSRTVTSAPMHSVNRVCDERRRKATSARSTSRGKEPEQPIVMISSIVPPFVPDAPQLRQGPPPTPRPQRLSTPDIPDVYHERQAFWQCHDPQRVSSISGNMIEKRTLPPPSLKMDGQCQVAIAHMGGRVPSAKQSRDFHFGGDSAFAEVSQEVERLTAMGYSFGTAIAILQDKNEIEEVNHFHPHNRADTNNEG
ncbi:hypothetical protein ACMFMG_010816 [Clarireedia jacksonii]